MKTIPVLVSVKSETWTETKVSDEDFERLQYYQWRLNAAGYASRKGRGGCLWPMHRFIMPSVKGMYIDHINRDRLDNQRENLRIITPQKNAWNAKHHKDNSSGYKGIFLTGKNWQAVICVNGKRHNLGHHATPEAAARAYDDAAREYFGEGCYLNFPKESNHE